MKEGKLNPGSTAIILPGIKMLGFMLPLVSKLIVSLEQRACAAHTQFWLYENGSAIQIFFAGPMMKRKMSGSDIVSKSRLAI